MNGSKKEMKKNAIGLRRYHSKNKIKGGGNALSITLKPNVHSDGGRFARRRRTYATKKSGRNATNLRGSKNAIAEGTNDFTDGGYTTRKGVEGSGNANFCEKKSGRNATNSRGSNEGSNNTAGGNAWQINCGGNTTANNVDGSGNTTYYIYGNYKSSRNATLNLSPLVESTNSTNGNVTTFMGNAINFSDGNVTKTNNRLSGNAIMTKNKNANESGNALMANAIVPTRPNEREAGGTKNTMQVYHRSICEIVVYFIKKGIG